MKPLVIDTSAIFPSLSHPPLLILRGMDSIIIHIIYTSTLAGLLIADKRRLLKWAFSEPGQVKVRLAHLPSIIRRPGRASIRRSIVA
jgi:hypothetical protein